MPNCSCTIRCDCIISSLTEETLEAAPDYLRKDAIRWNSAAHLYEDLKNLKISSRRGKNRNQEKKSRSQYHSPEHSPPKSLYQRRRLSHSHQFFGGSMFEIGNKRFVGFSGSFIRSNF
ncbi:hypothetical protein B9Z55_022049 [Caenorhabditis nigoni]|nr:hypothetical protein B9Z55_022049 [Caenorhabditis nigoni]